jgi:acetylornithine deacetylase
MNSSNEKIKDAQIVARRLIRPLRSGLRRLLQELVRIDTVAIPPNGNETPAQLALLRFLRSHGINSELYEVEPILEPINRSALRKRNFAGRKNLFAWIEGRGKGKSLLLNGHMDTVPPGRSKWSAKPWSGNYHRGRVHGLGAFDMKGGLVANTAVICALKDAGIRLGGDLFFESVIDEEWGGGGGTLAARRRGPTADGCVIPEGTQLDIYRATRGGFIVDLIIDAGDPSKYFSPAEVVSPAAHLGRLLGWVENWARIRRDVRTGGAYAGIPDPTPVQVLAVEANTFDPEVPLSVPTRAKLRVYFQFLPDEEIDALIRKIIESLRIFCNDDPFFADHPIQFVPLLDQPLKGQELPLNHPLVECVAKNAEKVLGRASVVTAAPFPCDAGLIQQEFGIPTLLFGPAGAGAHNPDEYVEFESVIQTAEVILGTVLDWSNA